MKWMAMRVREETPSEGPQWDANQHEIGSPLPPFEEIFRRYSAPIYRYCFLRLRNHAAAEDMAEETFVKAFAAYERVRPMATQVEFWLMRIAHNTVVDHVRKSRTATLL